MSVQVFAINNNGTSSNQTPCDCWVAKTNDTEFSTERFVQPSVAFFKYIFISQRNGTFGGSLKFWQGSGWFCMRFHFFIKASFIIDTKGWYCATKGIVSFPSLFCFRRAAFLSLSFTSNSNFSFKIVWLASVHQVLLKSEILSPQRSLFVGFSRLLSCQTGTLTTGG